MYSSSYSSGECTAPVGPGACYTCSCSQCRPLIEEDKNTAHTYYYEEDYPFYKQKFVNLSKYGFKEIILETEKALLYNNKYSDYTLWLPKSVVSDKKLITIPESFLQNCKVSTSTFETYLAKVEELLKYKGKTRLEIKKELLGSVYKKDHKIIDVGFSSSTIYLTVKMLNIKVLTLNEFIKQR